MARKNYAVEETEKLVKEKTCIESVSPKKDKETDKLVEYVPIYGSLKEREKELASNIAYYNSAIKEQMTSRNLDGVTAGGYTAKLTMQNRDSLDTEALIQHFQTMKAERKLSKKKLDELVVRTVSYRLDTDVLEDMIYRGELSAEVLQPFKVTNSVQTLRVTKVKAKRS